MSGNLCRDFENGKCQRGGRCKFFHPKLLICRDFQNKKCSRDKCRYLHVTREEEEAYNNGEGLPEHIDEDDAKSKRILTPDDTSQNFGASMYGKRPRDDGFSAMLSAPALPNGMFEDNEMLKRKVTDLQREVMDLRQMNDTLYDQNTRYRNQLRGGPVANPQTDPYRVIPPV